MRRHGSSRRYVDPVLLESWLPIRAALDTAKWCGRVTVTANPAGRRMSAAPTSVPTAAHHNEENSP